MIHPSQKMRRSRASRAAFATGSSPQSLGVTPKHLVAIGGAAGAVGPLKAILWRMALHLDAAFVVLLHRSSQHRTRLVEQLAAQSMIPVTFAIDGTTLEAGHAYVVPPGEQHARIERNRIRLGAGSRVWHHRGLRRASAICPRGGHSGFVRLS